MCRIFPILSYVYIFLSEPHLSLIPFSSCVGRRGTNQLRLLERYHDVLVKHTTEIPPPTALVEETAPSALVEDESLG
jgi:hypothetical protein